MLGMGAVQLQLFQVLQIAVKRCNESIQPSVLPVNARSNTPYSNPFVMASDNGDPITCRVPNGTFARPS